MPVLQLPLAARQAFIPPPALQRSCTPVLLPYCPPSACRYMSHEELSDSAVPFAVKYLAGWGVVLSRDLMQHAVAKANLYTLHPELAPPWFK